MGSYGRTNTYRKGDFFPYTIMLDTHVFGLTFYLPIILIRICFPNVKIEYLWRCVR